MAFFVLQNSKVQTYLTQKIAKEVSKNLNAKFEVESVNFRFFNRIVLKNVYIEDQLKDTLLFSEEIICNLKKLDKKQRVIDLSNINLVNAKIYLHKFDSLQAINIRFVTEDSYKKDTSVNNKPKWQISFKNVEMHKSTFRFKSFKKIWASQKRNKILTSKLNYADCPIMCYHDPLNELLWNIWQQNKNGKHINFV